MICPHCGFDNLPGNAACTNCQQDLTPLDRPSAGSRVERSLMEDAVAALPLPQPVTIAENRTVGEALELMLVRNVGALLVVDPDGKLAGIFTERDLLKKIVGVQEDYSVLPVTQFMTAKPESVRTSDTLAFVLHKMDGGGYRHVPVLEGDRPVGIVSVRDMLRHITRLCKHP